MALSSDCVQTLPSDGWSYAHSLFVCILALAKRIIWVILHLQWIRVGDASLFCSAWGCSWMLSLMFCLYQHWWPAGSQLIYDSILAAITVLINTGGRLAAS